MANESNPAISQAELDLLKKNLPAYEAEAARLRQKSALTSSETQYATGLLVYLVEQVKQLTQTKEGLQCSKL